MKIPSSSIAQDLPTQQLPNAERSKLRGRPRKEQSSAIESDIRKAAIELFGELGFSGAAMEAIAVRAGVSKRTLYMRYPDKKALFKDVVESIVSDSRVPDPPDFPDMAACLAFHVENCFMICNDPGMRVLGAMGSKSSQHLQELVVWGQEFTQELGIRRISQTISDTARKTGMKVLVPDFYAASLLDLTLAHDNRSQALKLSGVASSTTIAAVRIVRLLLAGMHAEANET